MPKLQSIADTIKKLLKIFKLSQTTDEMSALDSFETWHFLPELFRKLQNWGPVKSTLNILYLAKEAIQ
jgi:hypothetical protein